MLKTSLAKSVLCFQNDNKCLYLQSKGQSKGQSRGGASALLSEHAIIAMVIFL